ncbi:hypothetical protein BH20ACT15_BH20ACT15_08040 [soil metagenome]
MFHLHRFHWKRKRAALATLPVAAMMVTTGIAAGATGIPGASPEGAATSGGRADTDVSLRVKRHVNAGGKVMVRGKVKPGGRRSVTIRIAGRKAKVRTKPNGKFAARLRAPGAGIYKVKAVVQRSYGAKSAGSRSRQVNVYRPGHASYYGPGLYGNGTACGRALTPSTLGVANKSLPCGTKVTFRYRGKSVRVPVIDRGPFAGNREWDLTAATKAKLGFGSTGVVYSTK